MIRRRSVLALVAFAPATAASAGFRGAKPGEVLRGRFDQERRMQGFARPLISSGDFVLAPGLGLIWRTEKPFAITTVVTALGLVQEIDGTETNRMSAARLPFLARLYDILGGALAGDWHALEGLFQLERHGDDNRWDLALTPRGGTDPLSMPFRSIALRGGTNLDEVRIVRLDGDSDTIAFRDQAVGGALTDAEATRLREAGK